MRERRVPVDLHPLTLGRVNSPSPVPCSWWARLDALVLYLRRYVHSDDLAGCPVLGYHSAMAYVGSADHHDDSDGIVADPSDYAGDQRWPVSCACGYEFAPGDPWQVFTDRLMVGPRGQTSGLRDLPVGAMYDARWQTWKGPDGISLMVVCPPAVSCRNHWLVDGPARPPSGEEKFPAWTRTGDPREPGTLTCSPSIEIGFSRDAAGEWVPSGPCYYHGHLQAGSMTPG